PYTETFLLRSTETSFRLGAQTNVDGALVTFSLFPTELNPAFGSANVVGYAMMPALLPCSPDQADGSPTNFFFALELLPDVPINQLIQDGSGVYGVDFTWGFDSTFVLQGTSDFNNWTNVAYIWSYPPETAWTTNQALNSYGSFFRIALVANDHISNLPPLY